MGCAVAVDGATTAEARRIEQLFADRDRMFSRFRPDSELSRVNRARASVVAVSPAFAEMVAWALRAAATTDGLVDPTLGEAIEAAGYDRDFDDLRPDPAPAGEGVPGRWPAVRVTRGWLSRPHGLKLDLNGVVKGRTVDDALALIAGPGFVSAGGDVAASRPVDVALPGEGAVRLVHGGLATSGTARRRWRRAGSWQHHLIDPRSGRSAESPWIEVTVSAGTCLRADVAAKAASLLGDTGPAWLDESGLPGRFLGADGIVANRRWAASLHRAAA